MQRINRSDESIDVTLDEFNTLRRRLGHASLTSGLSFMAGSLLAPAKLLVPMLLAFAVCGVSGFVVIRYRKRIQAFRCPTCGEDPTTWVSPDPTDDAAHFDQFTNQCLHCKAWLGEVD